MENKRVVLLVDDDPLIIQTYQTEFELSGFDVLVANDGATGFKIAQEKKPEIILLDILMPIMTGLETLRKLKDEPGTKEIPVFILTNIGQEEAVKEALESGAVDFILKYRFTPAEVVGKVKQTLPQ